MSSLDGFWTYIVPGTQRGGLLAVKDGVVVGGDNIAFFEGVLSEAEGHVSGTLLVTRFNEHAELDGLWGKSPRQYAVLFSAIRDGLTAAGSFERSGVPNGKLDVLFSYRGSAP